MDVHVNERMELEVEGNEAVPVHVFVFCKVVCTVIIVHC